MRNHRIVPVEFEVKEFKNRDNSLYISVVLIKTESEVLEKGLAERNGSMPSLLPDSNVSIADIIKNVNCKDGRSMKYLVHQ